MSYSYQFRLKIIKLVTEQEYGIREVAKLHQISHALVIYWLKAFRERGPDGVKSPYTNLQTPRIVKSNHALNDLLHVSKMPCLSFYYKEVKRNYHEEKEAILSLYKKNKNRDGYRPMTLKLRQRGFYLNHKTVLKLMNELPITLRHARSFHW